MVTTDQTRFEIEILWQEYQHQREERIHLLEIQTTLARWWAGLAVSIVGGTLGLADKIYKMFSSTGPFALPLISFASIVIAISLFFLTLMFLPTIETLFWREVELLNRHFQLEYLLSQTNLKSLLKSYLNHAGPQNEYLVQWMLGHSQKPFLNKIFPISFGPDYITLYVLTPILASATSSLLTLLLTGSGLGLGVFGVISALTILVTRNMLSRIAHSKSYKQLEQKMTRPFSSASE